MGKRKDQYSRRERTLMRFTHLEEYLTQFLKVFSTPTKRWPKIEEALEEVARERLLLAAEVVEDAFPKFPQRMRQTRMSGE